MVKMCRWVSVGFENFQWVSVGFENFQWVSVGFEISAGTRG